MKKNEEIKMKDEKAIALIMIICYASDDRPSINVKIQNRMFLMSAGT